MEKQEKDFFLEEIQRIGEELSINEGLLEGVKRDLGKIEKTKKEEPLEILNGRKAFYIKLLKFAEGPGKEFYEERLKDTEKAISKRSLTEGEEFAHFLSESVEKQLIKPQN
jgi:hypothetical protein